MVCDALAAWVLSLAVIVVAQVSLYLLGADAAVQDGSAVSLMASAVPIAVWLVVTLATGRTVGDHAVELRFTGGPLPVGLARTLRFVGGIGGWLLLSALPGFWGFVAVRVRGSLGRARAHDRRQPRAARRSCPASASSTPERRRTTERAAAGGATREMRSAVRIRSSGGGSAQELARGDHERVDAAARASAAAPARRTASGWSGCRARACRRRPPRRTPAGSTPPQNQNTSGTPASRANHETSSLPVNMPGSMTVPSPNARVEGGGQPRGGVDVVDRRREGVVGRR